MKVNEAKKLLVSSKMHIIKKLQRGIDFQRIINGFQRKLNFPQCLGAIDGKFGIGASTACMKVNKAMKLLVSSKMHIISKLQRSIDFQRIINGFQRKWNFPLCLGAIDGTHTPIKAPPPHHSDYYNRKSFHSVILQGVCDSQCCFTDVFAGWPGRFEGVWSLPDRNDDKRGNTHDTR